MAALKRLRACSAGVVAVVTAMVLPVLLGFVGLGSEVGHWYLAQREMQGAADAAAISAAAEYIQQINAGTPASTSYQTVGQSYASLNGFIIPTLNVCLVTSSGDNCDTVRSLDARTIICSTPPCVVVEITQNTSSWLTTLKSVEPMALGRVQPIPTPTLMARAIVTATSNTTTTTGKGADCVLALANDPQAVLLHGNGILKANCGIAIDGGRDQNVSGTPLGGITFNGNAKNTQVQITNLVVASNGTGCPSAYCFLYSPSTTALPASAIKTNTATLDPYAATLNFPTPPSGVKTGGVVRVAQGSGYTNGTCTFTVSGGTFYGATSTPAKFTATIAGGKVTTIGSVIDPGAYTVLPTSPVSATSSCGGSGATFTLTEGCFTWASPPIAGRKYCSINLNGAGTTNFPAGSYYIAGGDASCAGFCVSSATASVTSDVAGVTFFLTKGEGAGTFGTTSYATVHIASGTVALCAPGTGCGTGCSGTCMLFEQNPAATASTAQSTPSNTINTFSGNGNRTLSGLIYLPKQTFAESGNGPILGCVGVIAKYIDVGGTPTFSNGCLPGNGIGGTTTTVTTWGNPYLYQ
jgi:Flp pilus assembly protein TadG